MYLCLERIVRVIHAISTFCSGKNSILIYLTYEVVFCAARRCAEGAVWRCGVHTGET